MRWLVVHYTGVNGYNDHTKDVAYARSVASYGKVAGKTWEYNYLIGLGGTVFEDAGDRVAAHCARANDISIGVLLMLGIGVAPTTAMIDAFRQLRHDLVASGALRLDHQCVPHYRLRATGCPGLTLAAAPSGRFTATPTGEGSLGDLIPDLLAPWVPPAPPPSVPLEANPTDPIIDADPDGGDAVPEEWPLMQVYVVPKPGPGPARAEAILTVDERSKVRMSGVDTTLQAEALVALGLRRVEIPADQYDALLALSQRDAAL
ncbi:MAG TPA: peptidoglycan recognition family protein [Solirubrobacter sp.]|nr:peptidoglycan recognition family protein [Solirubrobacter sp.]